MIAAIKQLHIPHFRGVFCRNELPRTIHKNEVGILNLDTSNHSGTHWVGYVKKDKIIYYYDSFGNLRPPLELKLYFANSKILYNYEVNQTFNSFNCGHLCLKFIKEKSEELFR